MPANTRVRTCRTLDSFTWGKVSGMPDHSPACVLDLIIMLINVNQYSQEI
jgi:hypothetical protein